MVKRLLILTILILLSFANKAHWENYIDSEEYHGYSNPRKWSSDGKRFGYGDGPMVKEWNGTEFVDIPDFGKYIPMGEITSHIPKGVTPFNSAHKLAIIWVILLMSFILM